MTARFRIWDNHKGEYREDVDSFRMDNDGNILWYDGCPLNGDWFTDSSADRYEVEWGNSIFFENDVVEAEVYGGSWKIQYVGMGVNDKVPRNHRNMFEIKGDQHDIHTLYWDIPVYGVTIMDPRTLEFTIIGFTEKDEFYYPDGARFSQGELKVVGNIRTGEFKFDEENKKCFEYWKKQHRKEKP